MALESDIKNPDSHLQVSFYTREVLNEFRTAAKAAELKKSISDLEPHEFERDKVDYIRIEIPGNKLLDIDTPVREMHKKRFPNHWAAYMNRGDRYGDVAGTPIEQWPRIGANADMARELRHLKFNTIQAIAGASDSQLQSIGMIAGQNAFTFRDDARRYLATIEAESKLSDADKKQKEADEKLAEANAKLQAQQEQHAKDMEEMRAQMKQLMELASKAAPEARKPGRPPKEAD
jgi:hypothetical protein